MRKTCFAAMGFAGALACFLACGSSSDGGSSGRVCTPGATQSCVGSGGCSGGQSCNADGSGYLPCDCGGGSDGGSSTDAGSGDAGVDSGSFTPAGMPGLVLWLSGDDVAADGGAVSKWPDQSGRGHDLVAGAHAPVVAHDAIGGRDAIQFSSTTLSTLVHSASETDFGWGSDDFVFETVIDFDLGVRGLLLALFDSPSHNLNFQVNDGDNNAQYIWGGDMTSAPLTGGPHLVGFRRTGMTTGEFHVDGTVTPITVNASTAHLTTSASIAVGGTDPVYSDGDIAEILLVHNPTDADVTNLESYLKSKYGL